MDLDTYRNIGDAYRYVAEQSGSFDVWARDFVPRFKNEFKHANICSFPGQKSIISAAKSRVNSLSQEKRGQCKSFDESPLHVG